MSRQPSLTPAKISVAIALITEKEISRQISKASQAIANLFENNNIIDNRAFPAHISLYLGGFAKEDIPAVKKTLEPFKETIPKITLTVKKIRLKSPGFIYLDLELPKVLLVSYQKMIESLAVIHQQDPVYRPRIINRWAKLTGSQKASLKHYGDYKIKDRLNPHISIALVVEKHGKAALKLAKEIITLPQEIKIRRIQAVDIGHKNEKWQIL